MTKPKKINTYHHGDLHAALLETSLALIEEKGAQALTIREVARRAGVSHAAPYRHFRDKVDLLHSVAEEGLTMMIDRMRRRMAEHPNDPLMRFRACGLAYIDLVVQYPSHIRVMFGAAGKEYGRSEKARQTAAAIFDLLLEAIRDCQADGSIRAGNPKDMALAAWSMVHGFAVLYIDRHVIDTGAYEQEVTEMMALVTETLFIGLKS